MLFPGQKGASLCFSRFLFQNPRTHARERFLEDTPGAVRPSVFYRIRGDASARCCALCGSSDRAGLLRAVVIVWFIVVQCGSKADAAPPVLFLRRCCVSCAVRCGLALPPSCVRVRAHIVLPQKVPKCSQFVILLHGVQSLPQKVYTACNCVR